ncbi:diaminopimelate epimerase [Albibacterium indicum]|uniref:diaminopimelate epimerase n=1 Tax=Albibacterium indicum TaxID=2292082 RepID=UPI000E5123E2|nr:diaminopimelate epimerase [Pedobacter indicus]
MQSIHFFKYQGAGNDFIIVDNREKNIQLSQEKINHLCDRRFGIGADGFMLLQNSAEGDFEMIYHNADGQLGSMCGNGGRCIVAFAKKIEIVSDHADFIAIDGRHTASINDEGNWVSLKMQDVDQIQIIDKSYVLDTGSPHYVKLVNELEAMDVKHEGASIRNSTPYKKDGINVNFVSPEEDGYFVRTFERGVEDETLACGTGVTAVALAMAYKKGENGQLKTPIRALGGNLLIRFHADNNHFRDIYLEGPAEYVFEGTVTI